MGTYMETRMKNNLSEEEYNALVRDAMRWRSEDHRCFDAAFKALARLESVRFMWNGPICQAVDLLRAATGPQPNAGTQDTGEVKPGIAAGESASPRTDAIENEASFEELADFARQLERELSVLPVCWVIAVEEYGQMVVYGPQYRSRESAEQDATLARARGQKSEVLECHRASSETASSEARYEDANKMVKTLNYAITLLEIESDGVKALQYLREAVHRYESTPANTRNSRISGRIPPDDMTDDPKPLG